MQTTEYSKDFEAILDKLDLLEKRSVGSVIFLSDTCEIEDIGPAKYFALETASKYHATAVYFREFGDSRRSVPQIYIYDNTKDALNTYQQAQIQRWLWSSSIIPLFIIINKSSVDIFDSRIPVQTLMDQILPCPIETLEVTSTALREYSAKLFDNGTFWEKERNSNNFLDSTSAYSALISGLKKIRSAFINRSDLPPNTSHKLLVQSILIKYLEERGEEGEALFAKNFFKQFGADDFCGVLRKKGEAINLFNALGHHFSGKIFSWEDQAEVNILKAADLSLLADFLDANIVGNQYVIWRQYSFNHLPIELISSIYEEFLSNRSDVVYTPHFLVNALIDECMPIDQPKINFKLLDGSCGSGIFLVSAFKRLLEWWRYSEYKRKGIIPSYPSLTKLKQLLKSSIFGIDIEEDATRLTVFSLCLALCDILTPKQIWTELKFDDLSVNNILHGDFFGFIAKNERKFDLVIGNPPFIEFNQSPYEELVTKYKLVPCCKIPQYQIALLFLDQAMRVLKTNGNLCLIMPSGPLLYNNTLEFRKNFFNANNVTQIVDFTNLSDTLFGKANVATCAIFVQKNKLYKDILHIAVRRTKASNERLFFELDHYDFHTVAYEDAINERQVWKANIFGGNRVFKLIKRFSETRTLKEYLECKRKNDNWDYGQGYIVAVKNRIHKASYITGRETVISDYFTEHGIGKIEIQNEILFKDKSREALFQPPHLLIKKNIGGRGLPVAYSSRYLTFTDNIMGIHAPKSASQELRNLEHFLKTNSDTIRFLISIKSGRSGVSRSTSTVLAGDITNLPFPLKTSEMKLSPAEKIIRNDVLNYYLEYISRGENARINTLALPRHIYSFSDTFCRILNGVYEKGARKFRLVSQADVDPYIILCFAYTGKEVQTPKISNSKRYENLVKELVEKQTGKSIYINRVIRLYEKDKIYLIKPKQIRYWLGSIALRDADETAADLINSGY